MECNICLVATKRFKGGTIILSSPRMVAMIKEHKVMVMAYEAQFIAFQIPFPHPPPPPPTKPTQQTKT